MCGPNFYVVLPSSVFVIKSFILTTPNKSKFIALEFKDATGLLKGA